MVLFNKADILPFLVFLLFPCGRSLDTRLNLHQLPRETLWMEWIKPLVVVIPPTGGGIVTENTLWAQSYKKLPFGYAGSNEAQI